MNKRIFLFFLLAISVAFLFWYSSALQNKFYIIVDFLSVLVTQNEFLAIFVFIITSAIAALISPLTNIPLIPIATIIWGPIPTIILLLTGWLIGDMFAYFIGRYFGYKVVCYFVSPEILDGWSSLIKSRTSFLTALLARLALPAELGYAFGIIRYPMGTYAIITFLSELPFAVVSTYVSEAVLFGNLIRFFGLMGTLFVVVFTAFRFVHKTRKLDN